MADVIGSAEIEIRATTRQLKSDMARAEKETKAELRKVEAAAKDAQRELKRAFSDAGQTEFERSMRIIRNASDHTEDEVRAAAQRVAKDLKSRYHDLGADIGRSLMGVSRTAQLAFAAITAYSLKLASDAGEIESAFAVAFGSAEANARSFSDTLAEAVGRDAVVLREQMTRLQLVITGTGVAAETSAEMVKALTTAGVDAGSLFNTSDAEALQKIVSGLTGETEPLKAFGVVITEAAVKAELLRLGFKGNASEASEAAKSIARANLILKGLSVAQGDAARTADSAANTTKRMTAEFNVAARDLGTQLLPVMIRVFGAATDVLRAFNDLPGGVQVAGLAFLGLIAAGGPIAGLLANLAKVISLAKATRAALIAAGAGGAGAGGAAAAGGLLAPAAAIAGTLSLSGDTSTERVSSAEGLAITRRQRAAEQARGPRTPGNARSERLHRETLARYDAQIAEMAAREARLAPLREGLREIAGPQGDEPVDASVVGGFGLPAGLRSGGGSGGGRRSARSGPSEQDLAQQREMLDLQGRIELLRAQGNDEEADSQQRILDVLNLTKQYEAAGFENAKAKAETQVQALVDAKAAEEALLALTEAKFRIDEKSARAREEATEEAQRQADILMDQLGFRAEIARLEGNPDIIEAAERKLWIEGRINELLRLRPGLTAGEARTQADGEADQIRDALRTGDMREEFRNAVTDGIRAAIDGDLGSFFESLADRFTDRMLENLADDLFDLLSQAAKVMAGNGESSGWMNAIGSFIGSTFGGGRASGGPMMGGSWYRAGEHGPENIFMPRDGFAIPKGGMAGAPSGGGRQSVEHLVRVVPERDSFIQLASDTATPLVADGSAAAYQGARNTVPADMAGAARYTRGRGR